MYRMQIGKTITLILMLAGILVSCKKENVSKEDTSSTGEIILSVEDDSIPVEVSTKTSAVTSMPSSLYWGATTGSGTETAKWSSASASVSASKISTGKYQTASPTTYNYYLSNLSMSVGANTTVTATGGTSGTDVICGRASSSSVTPSVTLGHIFARTGSLTLNVPSGYTATSVTWQIVKSGANTGTSGMYNLRTGAWSSCSGLVSNTSITGSSDIYVVPGVYTITCSFTLTKGDFTKSYTETGNVTLAAGKINNITATTMTDEAVQVSFSVSVSAWSDRQTDLTAADFS